MSKIGRIVGRGLYAGAAKLLMSPYRERPFILVPIAELNAVRSHSSFAGQVSKIDLGFDRFFALAGPETTGGFGRRRVFVLWRR